jgi:hypothetical protein
MVTEDNSKKEQKIFRHSKIIRTFAKGFVRLKRIENEQAIWTLI